MLSVMRPFTPLSNNTLCFTCELDKLPVNMVTEFKQILVSEIHKKLPLNFRSMGKKSISIPCPESYDAYQELSEVLNSDQWGKRAYSQNQQTYVVCLDTSNNTDFQNQSENDIDPLEQLLQSLIKTIKTTKKGDHNFCEEKF
ncbi:hypothetical protein C1645_882719 [Glomus cerebriforme]|uniref:Uncharacterized protein n=1 Tax=Glomus cerebriforme TaxID=658196 RepID=A0A397S3P8_9GLOM|nr:hypothetical protein C1645_882719 [Glomus cerebriforme]